MKVIFLLLVQNCPIECIFMKNKISFLKNSVPLFLALNLTLKVMTRGVHSASSTQAKLSTTQKNSRFDLNISATATMTSALLMLPYAAAAVTSNDDLQGVAAGRPALTLGGICRPRIFYVWLVCFSVDLYNSYLFLC